jgi:hypothetical protein
MLPPPIVMLLRADCGIMWVIEDHRALRAHIMPDHVGDRGAVRQILEPRDRLHINHERTSQDGSPVRGRDQRDSAITFLLVRH